jgi:hypothetical protein
MRGSEESSLENEKATMSLFCSSGKRNTIGARSLGKEGPGERASSITGPALSVVVCTRNRLDKLRSCVDALLAVESRFPWEVVIVDNDSDDGTSEYLASINANLPNGPNVITTFEAEHGLGTARNRGWRIARGEIVAFTDDDCYVSEDFVNAFVEVFEEESTVGFAGGRILLFNPLDYEITIHESKVRQYFAPRSFIGAGEISGANMAFRRAVLERIGGFDGRMGHGAKFSCEDIDAIAAAIWAGFAGVYDPRPVVYHDHGRRTKLEAKRLQRIYARASGAYFVKYILNEASRSAYLKVWMRSLIGEFSGSLRRGSLPNIGRVRAELCGALAFAVTEYKARRNVRIPLGARTD